MPKHKIDVNEDLNVSIGDFFKITKEAENEEPPTRETPKDIAKEAPKKDSKSTIDKQTDIRGLITQIGKISLQHQKAGRGGRTVTLISIGEAKSIVYSNLEALLKELKKSLGCGGQIEDGKIVLHGEIADRASEWFTKMGLKSRG
jgi:translation initiation factor 1 (eIF-1/SUI1)